MKDVHRSRGHLPVFKENMMEVDQGKGKSRGKKGRSSKGKRKRQGKSKGKGKGKRPKPCFLCHKPHWARDCPSHHGGTGKHVNPLGKGHKNSSTFRQACLEGDKNFASFDFDGNFIFDSGATTSMGGVDLLQRIQEMYAQAGLRPTSRERTKGRVDKCFACTIFALKSHILHSSAERARTSTVGSRCARRFGTCRRSRRLHRGSESFAVGKHCRAVSSRHLAFSCVLSQKKVNSDTRASLAHAHGNLKINRNPLLCVYRDVPVKNETTHDSEIDLSVEPHTSCDQAIGDYDVISQALENVDD